MFAVASPGKELMNLFCVINFSAHFLLAVRIGIAWVRAEVAETARVTMVTVALDVHDMGDVMRLWPTMRVADSISEVMLIYNAGMLLDLLAIGSDSGLLHALETGLALVAVSTGVWAGTDAIMA